MNFDASFDWRALLAWLFHWPPTPLEFVICMLFAVVIGGCGGIIFIEKRQQRWLDEHNKELESLRDMMRGLKAVGDRNRGGIHERSG